MNPYLNNSLGYTMLVDRKFKCQMKIKAGAYHAIEIKNDERSMVLKFKTSEQQKEWYTQILSMLENSGKCFHDSELLLNGSFAPIRENQKCKWYINAALYMEHVMAALNNAKEEIFITDWWLCPELFLKRPTNNYNNRLDMILLKKAQEGVKIYILVYKEIDMLLGLSSQRAKSVLTQGGKNTNIKVILHPKNSAPHFSLWSHHEKCVIIDQSAAFLGGIDLCFGRWDDDKHRLSDLGYDNFKDIDLKKYPLFVTNNENGETDPMNLNSALRSLITSTAVTCNLASNAPDNTFIDVEDTMLSFNKISLKGKF